MSFFSLFNLQLIQESIPKVDLESISKSLQTVNPTKTMHEYSESLTKSLYPLTAKTQQLLTTQLQQVQQLASTHTDTGIEISELPEDYLTLEANCDLLLKLYTDLLHYSSETYGVINYDFPPASSTINKIKDAHVGLILASKFNQLRNVSTPQEMENVLLGKLAEPENDPDTADAQVITPNISKTLYGQLGDIASRHGNEFLETSEPLAFALTQILSAYVEIASARLVQDKKIMADLNHALLLVLNEQFVRVNELRKRVYSARLEFDQLRSELTEDEESDELIAKEDELVSATEVAVLEMRKLVRPSKNIDLLKVLVAANKEYLERGAKRLSSLLADLNKIEIKEDDDEV